MESDLIPYQAAARIPAKAVLVLAPHADDETFGCGGAIAAHVAEGVPVHVVVLTDGAAAGERQAREDECRAACRILGCNEPEFWGLPDRSLAATADLSQRVAQRIADTGADLVYAPSPWELHPDHRAAASLAIEAVQATGVRVAFYEVGATLAPNLLLDITRWLDTKKAAIACYPSQLAQQDYADQVLALNRFRTYSLTTAKAAEAFLVLTASELARELPRLLAARPVSFGSEPAPAQPSPPLVSVLIRSVDRDTLQMALDSVAVQTYPAIEVVVMSAQPQHRDLPERCGPFPLRLVKPGYPLRRSQTANHALDAARGELLIFLDDDDWLLPSHVARLAQVLEAQPQVLAAYTGVALARADGTPMGQTVDLPYDGVRQLAGNLTPIHSVLFRRELLRRGVRFDEALDRYEDWDFWVQAARHTVFAHIPGVSAAYRIHESSGVHGDTGPQGESTQAIYEKWQTRWTPSERKSLMQRAWESEDLRRKIESMQLHVDRTHDALQRQNAVFVRQVAEIAELKAELARRTDDVTRQSVRADLAEHEAMERRIQLNDMLRSTSWRVSRPLRWLSGALRGRPAPEPVPPPTPAAPPPAPVVEAPAAPAAEPTVSAMESAARFKPTPLRMFPGAQGGKRRVSIVTDSINAGSLYGGVGTALILGTLLAEAMDARLRVVTRTQRADAQGVRTVLGAYGLELRDEPEFAYAPQGDTTVEIDHVPGELFLTTSWWTTHAALAALPTESILYLLQEDERMFYPHGDQRLLCEQLLAHPGLRFAVNSRLLFDHFVASGLGNVARNGMWFEPAFPRGLFQSRERPSGAKKRLTFYARPQNARNLYHFGIELLETAVTRGIVDLSQWEVVLLGREIPPVTLDAGAYQPLRMENLDWREYAEVAGRTDLALSLMYTPHPSYPPLDMAASGSVVLTNRYANKQDLSGYCANILSADLELEPMLAALREAIALAEDMPRREAQFAERRMPGDWRATLAPVVARYARAAP